MANDVSANGNVLRVALTRQQAADALGIGIRKLDELIAGRAGNRFPVVYLGSKPVGPVHDLERWLSEQAAQKKGGRP